MPFKASDIKVKVKVRKILSILERYHIYKFTIGKFSFIWLITPEGTYSMGKEKSFPYIKFKRAAI